MAKESWTIRKATASDAPALTECMNAAYRGYAERFEGKPLPPMTADYEQEISSYPVWVAESGGVVVGGLVLMPERGHVTIANVAIHPSYQGKGLGRALLTHGEKEAKRAGYTKLRLATHILLVENISLYAHLGWSEVNRDETRVYMEKTFT